MSSETTEELKGAAAGSGDANVSASGSGALSGAASSKKTEKRTPKKLGQKKEAYASYEPLDVPSWIESGLTAEKGSESSCMKTIGEFLHTVIKK